MNLLHLFSKPKYVLVYVDTLDQNGNVISYSNRYNFEGVWNKELPNGQKFKDWYMVNIPHSGIQYVR